MKIYRLSKGIKKPRISTIMGQEIEEKIKDAELVFEKTLEIEKEYFDMYKTTYINYRIFNKKPKKDNTKIEKSLNPF